MSNKELAKSFKLAAQLLELHGENPFKARSLQNAAFKIERLPQPIETLPADELESIDGIGKSIHGKIVELLDRKSFAELDDLLTKTPAGVIDMLNIKGIGPKKVQVLWKELGIESTGELLYACNENRLIELKGFGVKTQDLIRHSIEYSISNQGKFHFAAVEIIALQLLEDIKQSGFIEEISFTGALRRKCEILEKIEFVTVPRNENSLRTFLSEHPLLVQDSVHKKENIIHCNLASRLPVEIHVCLNKNFGSALLLTTGSSEHLKKLRTDFSFKENPDAAQSENEIYKSIGLPFFEPELREGIFEFELIRDGKLPKLIEFTDLKGILHNHTTYSDGAHTLEQMANKCKELGYEYLGICDHSKSAFYANGLQPERIIQQQQEIDKLNKQLAPFRIFKGIESDILVDGSLDYPDEILASFEFIVASVHSSLRMDISKATERIIKAIENPYTTILGHPTSRLLLAREGYPLDHHRVIDACAANAVIIELNANPYRLDLDWRYIQYALKKNVMVSINPDAHRMEGYQDMYYGVCVARKGGLTKEMTFNALSLSQIQNKFSEKK